MAGERPAGRRCMQAGMHGGLQALRLREWARPYGCRWVPRGAILPRPRAALCRQSPSRCPETDLKQALRATSFMKAS